MGVSTSIVQWRVLRRGGGGGGTGEPGHVNHPQRVIVPGMT